ncbi:MAG: aldehyde dehydrogenase family protein, partial [Gammaproteobacteria bacterium]|nr:aldehyde dehydrogenase family protein [Gammaproteobacteria bacterium]
MSKEIKKYRHYINGEWSDASDGGVIKTLNPAIEEVWAEAPAATAEDVDRAIAAAKSALYRGEWAAMTASQRGKILNRLGALIRENA